MSVPLIHHRDLISLEMPDTWRCLICRGPQRRTDGAPCERCNGWLHWDCYWPAILTDEERAAYDAAVRADEAVEDEAGDDEVDVILGGRRYRIPAFLAGPSAVDTLLSRQIILCPGCRS